MPGLDVPSGAQTRKLGSIKWIAHTRKKVSALYCFYYNFNVFIKLPLEYHSILNIKILYFVYSTFLLFYGDIVCVYFVKEKMVILLFFQILGEILSQV